MSRTFTDTFTWKTTLFTLVQYYSTYCSSRRSWYVVVVVVVVVIVVVVVVVVVVVLVIIVVVVVFAAAVAVVVVVAAAAAVAAVGVVAVVDAVSVCWLYEIVLYYVIFTCTGTPSKDGGSSNLLYPTPFSACPCHNCNPSGNEALTTEMVDEDASKKATQVNNLLIFG